MKGWFPHGQSNSMSLNMDCSGIVGILLLKLKNHTLTSIPFGNEDQK